MKDVTPGERIPRLVDEMKRMAASVEDFQVFYELLPHVMRDDALRRRMAMLFRWYWSKKLEWLGVEDGAAVWPTPTCWGWLSSSAPSSTGSPSRSRSTRTWTSPTRTGCSRGC